MLTQVPEEVRQAWLDEEKPSKEEVDKICNEVESKFKKEVKHD